MENLKFCKVRAVKTPDIEDKAIISDKFEADSYYLQCLYKYED